MTAYELVNKIRKEFFTRLNRKTGWGREELKLEFEGAAVDAVSKVINLSEHPDLGSDDLPF